MGWDIATLCKNFRNTCNIEMMRSSEKNSLAPVFVVVTIFTANLYGHRGHYYNSLTDHNVLITMIGYNL